MKNLTIQWSKKNKDIEYGWPEGVNSERDAYYLSTIMNREFFNELDRMGYNIKTVKFSIEPKEDCERFSEVRQKMIKKAKEKLK